MIDEVINDLKKVADECKQIKDDYLILFNKIENFKKKINAESDQIYYISSVSADEGTIRDMIRLVKSLVLRYDALATFYNYIKDSQELVDSFLHEKNKIQKTEEVMLKRAYEWKKWGPYDPMKINKEE